MVAASSLSVVKLTWDWYGAGVMFFLSQQPYGGESPQGGVNRQYWPVDAAPEWIALPFLVLYSIPLIFIYMHRKDVWRGIAKMEEPEPSDCGPPPRSFNIEALLQIVQVINEVRQLAKTEGNLKMEMRALRELVVAHTKMQNPIEAVNAMEDLLLLSEGWDSEYDYCHNLLDAGYLLAATGNSEKAVAYVTAAFAMAGKAGNEEIQVRAGEFLGEARENEGVQPGDKELTAAGHSVALGFGEPREEADFEWRCALVCRRLEWSEAAMEYAMKALHILRQIDDVVVYPLKVEIREQIKAWSGEPRWPQWRDRDKSEWRR